MEQTLVLSLVVDVGWEIDGAHADEERSCGQTA